MTNHPDLGDLRAALDDEAPAGVAEHAASCEACSAALVGLRADAAVTASALALLAPPRTATVTDIPRRTAPRLQRVLTAAAAGVLLVVVVGTPGGRQAAAAFLAQFRSERVSVVTVDPQQMGEPEDVLGALGTLDDDGANPPRPVASVPAAEALTGLDLDVPSADVLPAGLAGDPEVVATEGGELRLVFDTEKVRDYLATHGDAGASIPDGLDGAALVVQIPAAAALAYQGPDGAQLLVGQAEAVTASVEGDVTLDEVREFLLGLPGLPPDTVRQLRAIDDWRSTLPLPVPADAVTWEDTQIGGVPGVALRGAGGFGAALLWQDGGLVRGVGGLVSPDDVRRVAESLVE